MNWQDFPGQGKVKYITMQDGTRLRTAAWPSCGSSRGIIILVSGHREYMEKYSELISELLARDFAVYTFDNRGQGLSGRQIANRNKSHTDDFNLFTQDLNEYIRRYVMCDPRAQECPLYLMAHSMGGHIGLRYIHDYPGVIDKAILMAPMVEMNLGEKFSGHMVKKLIRLANFLGMSERFAFGQGHLLVKGAHLMRQKLLTHDRDRYAEEAQIIIANPDLYVGGATYGWLKAALDSIEEIRQPQYLDEISTSLMIILAGADRVVKNGPALELFAGHDRIEVVTIEGARHEIYREVDRYRQQLWQKIEEFLGVK